jgi:hypothetical protein
MEDYMRIPLIALLVLSVPVMARAADDWQRIVVIDNPRITVTFLLKKVATPADEEFVGFEFNNRTDQPLQVPNGSRYSLDHVELSPRGGVGAVEYSTGIASANDYYLLWDGGAPPPPFQHRDNVIPAGITSRLMDCSTSSLVSLGIPSAKGYAVDGRVHFQLGNPASTDLSTPDEGVPFHFEWLPPDDQGIAALRQRLRHMLETPQEPFTDAVGTLLADDRIASAVNSEDLVKGLKVHDESTQRPICEYIDQHYASDEHVIAFCVEVIKARDTALLDELADAEHLHDRRLIEPLVACVREDAQPFFFNTDPALKMLRRQRDLMGNRNAISAELGPIILARSPLIVAGSFSPDQAFGWYSEVQTLALTGDAGLVPQVAPFLDNKQIVIDVSRFDRPTNGVSTRACDLAYNTILDLQDQAGERFSEEPGLEARTTLEAEYARRDALIAGLKAELAVKEAARTQPTK